jgi:hypothetical protein
MNATIRVAARALLAATLLASAAAGVARAAEPPWKNEFAEICAKTDDAMSLPDAELQSLVARGEKLTPEIDRLGETERKVYSRRLKSCLDLYRFVLESRREAPPR